jgi:hypothetical protein
LRPFRNMAVQLNRCNARLAGYAPICRSVSHE